jgi:uncharacterized protein YjdB
MRMSVTNCLLALAISTLACSSGEITGPPLTSGGSTSGTTVGSVVITPPTSTDLIVGQSLNLVAAVRSTTGQDISTLVITWTSTDPSVISVSPTGVVKALKVGTAMIVGSSSGKSASVTLNVKAAPVGNVIVTMPNALMVGQSATASAVVTDPSGVPLTGRSPAWSSRSPGTAIVSSNGVVTGISAGSTVIDAVIDGIQGSAAIAVASAPIASIVVGLSQSGANPGQSATATAVVTDANGTILTDKILAWSSSNSGVATITQSGVITAVAPGTTTITAAGEGKSGTATFTVTVASTRAVASVNLSVLNPRPALGGTTQINATLHDASGSILTGRLITWSSANTAVATVSQSGLVTATGYGSSVITAVSENVQGTVTISVIPPAVTSVIATAPASTLQPTQTTQLAVVTKDAAGGVLTGRLVTYSSSLTAVATVSATGLVNAIARGSTVITVTSEGVTTTLTITVPPVAVVNVSATTSVLQPAGTAQATAALLDGSGAPTTNRVLSWTSSNPAVATVSPSGLVTAVAKGTANIVATSEGVTGQLTITVPTVTTINVTAPNASALQPAQTTQATATLLDVGGGPATNRIITWSSSTPAVATVSATGVVTALTTGTSTITATSEGVTGSLTVSVPPVNTVTITAPATSLTAGATAQATAVLRDANNVLATNRAIAWSSSAPAVATVSATGLVTGVAVGTTTISAVSEGKTGVLTFTVAPPGGNIAITTPQNTLMLNDQTQLTAVVTNSLGAVVSNAAVTWTSSDSTRATVTQTGLVKQVAGGSMKTVTITARSGTATQGSVIQLVGHQNETVAALPQTFMNTAVPAAPDVGGVIIPVPANGNLQAALNSAQLGDVIELANGAVFTGNFSLPNKGAGTKWITIRPANMTGMPAPGSRMTPTIAAAVRLPIIQSQNSNNAIGTNAGAHHYRFIGIEMTVKAGVVQNYAPIALENNQTAQTSLSQVPHDIVLDRVYIHGNATLILRRCLLLNSAYTAVIDSDLRECHDDGSDSQAIAGYNGPGPFKIVNNYLEGAGENVIFGGSDPGISGLVPSDIEIRRNHFFKPATWKGSQWLIKNHLELKNSQRVLVEGNIFENNWAHGQDGTSIVLKTVNQGGTCSWCVTQDVTVRYNVVRNVGSGFNIGGAPDGFNQSIHARRMTIHDNLVTAVNQGVFTGVARAFYMSGDPADVTIAHNTVMSSGTMNGAFVFGPYTGDPTTGGRTIRFNARDNVMDGGATGISGDRLGGGAAFTYYAPGGAMVGNVLVYAFTTAGYPVGNFYPTSYSSVGFVGAPTNFSLTSGSTYKSAGSDGRDPGADLSAVATATANVIVP